MATSEEYVLFVMEQIRGPWALRYRKMFGEYMIYVEDRPVLMVCDNTVFMKMLPCLEELMDQAETAPPYPSARDHYIVDVEDGEKLTELISRAVLVTPLPKPKKKK